MRLDNQRESSNVEDKRRMKMRGGKVGIGAFLVVLAALYFGIDPTIVFNVGQSTSRLSNEKADLNPQSDEMVRFVSKVLGSTEDTWHKVFQKSGQQYPAPKLVLFRGLTQTACGAGQKAGHHIQNLAGTSGQVQQARRSSRSETEANQYLVRLELQADCFAGVWAHHADGANRILEAGDVQEAMRAAAAIGDDALQKQAQGYSVPDSFTHGTSAQRMRWFNQGLKVGAVNKCDTFSVSRL